MGKHSAPVAFVRPAEPVAAINPPPVPVTPPLPYPHPFSAPVRAHPVVRYIIRNLAELEGRSGPAV